MGKSYRKGTDLYWLVKEKSTGKLLRYFSIDGKIRKGYELIRKHVNNEEMALKRIMGSNG
ncbi:MAG: hypothetical protein CEE38_23590 [Planctomycetes bacterium B3_Pla]|nr:MAG: hypothetical protein CEE38_23590 [Planctomycetes bacterium B3_Pla]